MDVRGTVPRDQPGGGSGRHQVARDFSLAIDRDMTPRGLAHIDAVACPAERYFDSVVGKAFRHQAIGDADRREDVHSALLQNTCANARQNVVGIPAFKDDVVHAIVMKNLSQQKAGGARAGGNNPRSPCWSFLCLYYNLAVS